MTTAYKDLSVTRGSPFKPGVLELEAKDPDDFDVDVPVSAFSDIRLKIWKNKPAPVPTPPDADLIAEVSLTPNATGSITQVSTNEVQLFIHGSVTALWTQAEYFYEVIGTLVVDGEPYGVVKGRLLVGWGDGAP